MPWWMYITLPFVVVYDVLKQAVLKLKELVKAWLG